MPLSFTQKPHWESGESPRVSPYSECLPLWIWAGTPGNAGVCLGDSKQEGGSWASTPVILPSAERKHSCIVVVNWEFPQLRCLEQESQELKTWIVKLLDCGDVNWCCNDNTCWVSQDESTHRQLTNKWTWPYSNKTLFRGCVCMFMHFIWFSCVLRSFFDVYLSPF